MIYATIPGLLCDSFERHVGYKRRPLLHILDMTFNSTSAQQNYQQDSCCRKRKNFKVKSVKMRLSRTGAIALLATQVSAYGSQEIVVAINGITDLSGQTTPVVQQIQSGNVATTAPVR